jgi:hypothetical protein
VSQAWTTDNNAAKKNRCFHLLHSHQLISLLRTTESIAHIAPSSNVIIREQTKQNGDLKKASYYYSFCSSIRLARSLCKNRMDGDDKKYSPTNQQQQQQEQHQHLPSEEQFYFELQQHQQQPAAAPSQAQELLVLGDDPQIIMTQTATLHHNHELNLTPPEDAPDSSNKRRKMLQHDMEPFALKPAATGAATVALELRGGTLCVTLLVAACVAAVSQ